MILCACSVCGGGFVSETYRETCVACERALGPGYLKTFSDGLMILETYREVHEEFMKEQMRSEGKEP